MKPRFQLVLVVDDEPYAREVIGLALEVAGFNVCTAADGLEGLEIVLRERPRLVLTDIHMPGLDGDRLATAIVERLGDEAPVIIGFSADADAVERLRHTTPFREVLRKPLSPRNLIAVVMSNLSDGSDPRGPSAST